MVLRLWRLPLAILLYSWSVGGQNVTEADALRTFIYFTSSSLQPPTSETSSSSGHSDISLASSSLPLTTVGPSVGPHPSSTSLVSFSGSITSSIETSTIISISIPTSGSSSKTLVSSYTGKVTYTTGISWGPLPPPPPLATDSDATSPTEANITQTVSSTIRNSTSLPSTTAPPITSSPECTLFDRSGSCLSTIYPSKTSCSNYDSDGICWPNVISTSNVPSCTNFGAKGEVIDVSGPCSSVTTDSGNLCKSIDSRGGVVLVPCPTATDPNRDQCKTLDGDGNVTLVPCSTPTDTEGNTCKGTDDQGNITFGPCATATGPGKSICTAFNSDGDSGGNESSICTTTTMPNKSICTSISLDGITVDDSGEKCNAACPDGGDLDEFGNCLTTTSSTTTCDITLDSGEPSTTFIIEPNPTTITITTTGDGLPTTVSPTLDFTPPVYCYSPSVTPLFPHPSTSTSQGFGGSPTMTVPAITVSSPVITIVTQKQPVTIFTNEASIQYPGGPATGKHTVSNGPSFHPLPPPPANTGIGSVDTPPPTSSQGGSGESGGTSGGSTGNGNGSPGNESPSGGNSNGGSSDGGSPNAGGSPSGPSTTTIGGVPVVIGPTNVIIGSSTVVNGISPPSTQVTIGQQTFTVNPSQVIGPGATIDRPVTNVGAMFRPTPMPTVISGIPVQIGPNEAIIGGSTFAIGAGAPQTSVVVNGQTISVGPGGLGFAQTTVAPPTEATHVIILGGNVFSALGPSVAVIGGSTITYGSGIPQETEVFNGETITLGPQGISFGTTTLGGGSNPGRLQLGIAGGVPITQIGASIVAIGGATYTINPNGQPVTTNVNGKPVTIGPNGIVVGDSTLTYPLNQDASTTQAVTAGGITFSEVGASLVNIGGTTYTIGPSAPIITKTYDGKPFSIGPGGVGFKTTTVSLTNSPEPPTVTGAAAAPSSSKSGASTLRCTFGVLVFLILGCVGYNI